MKYVSTRGQAPEIGFCDALLSGLADDGGLYVPAKWPKIGSEEIEAMACRPYAETAKIVLRPFIEGDFDTKVFNTLVDEAYVDFHHTATVPLTQIAPGHFVAELFHGPTLAFKDLAMQLLARLMDHVLSDRSRRATIIGATSGDTGGAAIEAFGGRDNVDIFILFPRGMVSDVQQRQMTTVRADNVHAIGVDGNFDDCQSLVKALFNHHAFRDEFNIAGVNSINWARIMAQIVYYFSTASCLGAPHKRVSFSVPTGNFGDVFAGFAAEKMGLPIDDLVIATNQNDILARTLESGRYDVREVCPSTSPSMDIQVSSNFERLLFEAEGRDGDAVTRMMAGLKQSGGFALTPQAHDYIRGYFKADRSDEDSTSATIKSTWQESNYLLDPHSAVGVSVGNKTKDCTSPMITLATAHPAKFPDAVKKASGVYPELPSWVGDLMERDEHFARLDNDQNELENFIRKKSRISR